MVKEAVLENGMFADSILENCWAERSRRGWTTLTSFTLQAIVIAVLLLIPLLTTGVLPVGRVLPTPIPWGAPPPPAPRPMQRQRPTVVVSNLADNILITPPSIPHNVQMVVEEVAPPQPSYGDKPGVPGGTGVRGEGWSPISPVASYPLPAPPPAPVARQFRTSKMLEGSLIRKVQPVYPQLAKTARVQGTVVLEAVIGRTGVIEHLQLISGHPMLARAAIEAVSQWRYKPYILNDEAIEVETQITVNFTLSGN
jgi:protein TonB